MSSTNFCTVNALGSCNNNLRHRQRGKDEFKREWFIEDNKGRNIYLGSYGYVDTINQMIQKAAIKCRSHKYWFPAKLHGDAMGLAAVYGLYLECAEGKLQGDWKVDKPVSFWDVPSSVVSHHNPPQTSFGETSILKYVTIHRHEIAKLLCE